MSRVKGYRRAQGFTLLEIIVVVVIFAIISLGANQLLSTIIDAKEQADVRRAELDRLQRVMRMVGRDIEQMSARGFRIEGEARGKTLIRADKGVAGSSADGLEFVRAGWRNPDDQFPRSELQRVAYRLSEDKFERLFYLYPDADVGAEPYVQQLLSEVEGLRFAYFDGSSWLDKWESTEQLPQAVTIVLTLPGYGEISRKFLTAPAPAFEPFQAPTPPPDGGNGNGNDESDNNDPNGDDPNGDGSYPGDSDDGSNDDPYLDDGEPTPPPVYRPGNTGLNGGRRS